MKSIPLYFLGAYQHHIYDAKIGHIVANIYLQYGNCVPVSSDSFSSNSLLVSSTVGNGELLFFFPLGFVIMCTRNAAKKTSRKNDVSAKDSLEISSFGNVFQNAKKAAADAPEVSEDKVESLKEQMANGTYNVSSKQVADKLVDQYFNVLG